MLHFSCRWYHARWGLLHLQRDLQTVLNVKRHASISINIVFSVSISFNWFGVCSVVTGSSWQHAGLYNAKQYWDMAHTALSSKQNNKKTIVTSHYLY